ncbi:hypothetical protein DPMN_063961 [Dreissena polymorpha]|uniref:Uncharacterized protein n=1 Tax=Dreissena polymorpha TaxID=45954 RepID=A0A9D4CBG5_DREPO|nr:hypothetical protein DPMN_063961 [Dreissena polymorpha]
MDIPYHGLIYSQQHITDLTGEGFLYRRRSFLPKGKAGQGIDDEDDEAYNSHNILAHQTITGRRMN